MSFSLSFTGFRGYATCLYFHIYARQTGCQTLMLFQCVAAPANGVGLQPSDIIPSNVRHFDAITGLDLHAVLEPLPSHILVRHFTLEYSLISGLHCQVSDALQDLQLLI